MTAYHGMGAMAPIFIGREEKPNEELLRLLEEAVVSYVTDRYGITNAYRFVRGDSFESEEYLPDWCKEARARLIIGKEKTK